MLYNWFCQIKTKYMLAPSIHLVDSTISPTPKQLLLSSYVKSKLISCICNSYAWSYLNFSFDISSFLSLIEFKNHWYDPWWSHPPELDKRLILLLVRLPVKIRESYLLCFYRNILDASLDELMQLNRIIEKLHWCSIFYEGLKGGAHIFLQTSFLF